MKSFIYPALIGNASALGVHWIYDYQYLDKISIHQSLLFMQQTKSFYEQAKTSYYVYPHSKIGDVSVQGQMLIWLYHAIKDNPNFNKADYENLLFDKFKPGGAYQGYVESYAKKLVIKKLSDELQISYEEKLDDTHLVGFIPYLVSKELNLTNEFANELVSIFSTNPDYLSYMKLFDRIFLNINEKGSKQAILEALDLAPKHAYEKLTKIPYIENINVYIKDFAGRACSIEQSIPVILYILYHQTSYEDALEVNAKVGGASADRAMLISACLSQIYEIPKSYINLTKQVLNPKDFK